MRISQKWFELFEGNCYKNMYYVERGHVFYDLLSLETEERFYSLPVPMFAKKYLGLSITGMERNLGIVERYSIKCEISSPFQTINGYRYSLIKEIKKVEREDQELYSSLSEKEKRLLDNLDLVLEEKENQFGKSIATDYISGSVEEGFWRNILFCYSAESVGMGICQCINHPTYEREPIPIKDVLELSKTMKHNSSV